MPNYRIYNWIATTSDYTTAGTTNGDLWYATYSTTTATTATISATFAAQIGDFLQTPIPVMHTEWAARAVRDDLAPVPSAYARVGFTREGYAAHLAALTESDRLRVRMATRGTPGRRARALLLRQLDRTQRRQVREHGYFELVSSSGRRCRLMTHTQVGNVIEIDAEGNRVAGWCAHPVGVPEGDGILTQKLVLETDDSLFFAVANRH